MADHDGDLRSGKAVAKSLEVLKCGKNQVGLRGLGGGFIHLPFAPPRRFVPHDKSRVTRHGDVCCATAANSHVEIEPSSSSSQFQASTPSAFFAITQQRHGPRCSKGHSTLHPATASTDMIVHSHAAKAWRHAVEAGDVEVECVSPSSVSSAGFPPELQAVSVQVDEKSWSSG